MYLPNPHGPLSRKVPPGAIEATNQRVSEIIQPSSGSTSNTKASYTKLTPAQRFTIGKRAAEYSTMGTMKYFAKKYPGRFGSLKETTV